MAASLLPRLSWQAQRALESHWKIVCRRIDRYAIRFLDAVRAAQAARGRTAAVDLVARWVVGPEPSALGLQAWERDRAAAYAYHEVGELERAARCLRAALIDHLCSHGSCRFAPDALAYLFLAAGQGLEAALTCRHLPTWVVPPTSVVPPGRLPRLVDELVLAHRDAGCDVRSLPVRVAELDSNEASIRERAKRMLIERGPSVSPALRSAAGTAGAAARATINELLVDWALDRAAVRFFSAALG